MRYKTMYLLGLIGLTLSSSNAFAIFGCLGGTCDTRQVECVETPSAAPQTPMAVPMMDPLRLIYEQLHGTALTARIRATQANQRLESAFQAHTKAFDTHAADSTDMNKLRLKHAESRMAIASHGALRAIGHADKLASLADAHANKIESELQKKNAAIAQQIIRAASIGQPTEHLTNEHTKNVEGFIQLQEDRIARHGI